MIIREKYLNQLWKAKDDDLVKILVGVRRCGKTSILIMLKEKLIASGVDTNQIIHINFEDLSNRKWKNGEEFHDEIASKTSSDNKMYLLIDEIHLMNNWPAVINSLRSHYNVDIYLTGSNTSMFSHQDMTLMTGRYILINVFPLSYNEMINFNNKLIDKNQIYAEMLKCTFPKYVLTDDAEYKENIISSIYTSIFEKDIMSRINIKDPLNFIKVASFIFNSIGKQISIKKIRDTLVSEGTKIAFETIEGYLNLLEKAYLIYYCGRYDLSGKKLLKTNGKYYAVDIGVAKKASNNLKIGSGQQFENFIYLELKKAGWSIQTINVNRDYEVDFLAEKNGEKMYIQVSESIIDENTRDREVRPFKYIKDNYPKYIITLDWLMYEFDACTHMNMFDFIKTKL